MNTEQIYDALCLHLQAMSPRPSIVWENRKWKGSDDTLLIIEDIPGRPDRRSLAGVHSFTGIFQVTVAVPLLQGVDDAKKIITRLQNHFYNYSSQGLEVRHFPEQKPGYSDGVLYRIPVQVRYQCFSQPA